MQHVLGLAIWKVWVSPYSKLTGLAYISVVP